MPVKDIALQIIRSLPNESSMDDIIHALYIQAKFAKGEQEIRKGKGICHAEAKQRIQKWLT